MATDGASHKSAGTLLHLEERRLETRHGAFRAHVFQNTASGRFALVLLRGDAGARAPLLTRVHSSCVTSEAFGACDCDCAAQLDAALGAIAREGRGAVFYLLQEGRGAGFAAKARDRMLVQASRHRLTTFEAFERMGLGGDRRRYDEVAFACRILGVAAPLRLLTNNPAKLAALEAEKLAVESAVPLHPQVSPFNLHYLASKSRSGHALGDPGPGGRAAELPEEVRCFEPRALRGAPRFLYLASYLLPIRLPRPARGGAWFRLHLCFDREALVERVALSCGRPDAPDALACLEPERILERLPFRERGAEGSPWLRRAAAMAGRGSGCAVFLPTQLSGEAGPEAAPADPGAELLLARLRRGPLD